MNGVHWHLALTHLPIVGILLGTILLTFGLLAKQSAVQRVALINFVLMALCTIPVFLTGEPAEEAVESLAGVTEQAIHTHEEWAESALYLSLALGAVALATFLSLHFQWKVTKTFLVFNFILALATTGVMLKVGNLGGQIRHTELADTFIKNQELSRDHHPAGQEDEKSDDHN